MAGAAHDHEEANEDNSVAEEHFLRGLKPSDVSLLQRVAEEAAERAVKKTFLVMGIDPEKPMESQADFVFLRSSRLRCTGFAGKVLAAVTVAVVGLVASALVVGIRVMLMTGKT